MTEGMTKNQLPLGPSKSKFLIYLNPMGGCCARRRAPAEELGPINPPQRNLGLYPPDMTPTPEWAPQRQRIQRIPDCIVSE